MKNNDFVSINFVVNGKSISMEVPPDRTLLDVLRDDLNLTGTKSGCREGDCGACTVIMDGKPVNSCLVFAGQLQDKEIVTIEGIGDKDNLHPLQKAFIEKGAVQCGFCIPGMIMSSKALLDHNTRPTENEIKEALSGNLCRCTGYKKIIEAVETAAEEIRKS